MQPIKGKAEQDASTDPRIREAGRLLGTGDRFARDGVIGTVNTPGVRGEFRLLDGPPSTEDLGTLGERLEMFRQDLRTAGQSNPLFGAIQCLMESSDVFSKPLENARRVSSIVSQRFELAEILDVPVHQLEQDDEEVSRQLLEHKAKRADQIAQELIQEETARKSQRRQRNRRPRGASRSSSPKRASTASSPEPKSTPKKPKAMKVSWADSTIQHLQANSRLQMREHPRVTRRWENKDIARIRTFGPEYESLSDEDLKAQRARHYLPGLERLVSSDKTKRLYNFETPQNSHGIVCELNYGDRKEPGVVYIGYGHHDQKLMIHRYFEPYQDFSDTSEVFQGRAISQVETEEEEQWESTTPFAFEKIEADGTINMTFPGEDHSLRIFPTRPQEALTLASGIHE